MLGPRGTARRPGGLLNGYREESARAPRHALMPMCQSTEGGGRGGMGCAYGKDSSGKECM
jgi:hypothetical protein